MAWERRGGRVYYYTARRVGGRVVKEYGGSGYLAELAARLDAADREMRRLDRAGPRIELDFLRAEVVCQREWLDAADRVVAEALERSGWHNVRRPWRRRRGAMGELQTVGQRTWVPAEMAAAAGGVDPAGREKAKKGDAAALRAVENYLSAPAARAFWGDAGSHVLTKWAELYAADPVVRGAVVRFASDLRAKLAGPDPGALDLVVAERVVLG